MPPHCRVNWEFLATCEGQAAPSLEGDNSLVMQGRTLWVFPPEVSHGWISKDAGRLEVATFHFSGIDPMLEKLVRHEGWLAAPLDPADVEVVRDLARELWSHYWKPTLFGDLLASRALATLCLIALRNHPICQQASASKSATISVETAERWIAEHLGDEKAISKAATAAGVSRPQLYRLIQQVRGCSPRRLLLHLKLDRAKRMMAESDIKLHAVGLECGFSNASAFCRAFRAAHGCTPARWREEYHILYREPAADKTGDPGAHRFVSPPRDLLVPLPAADGNNHRSAVTSRDKRHLLEESLSQAWWKNVSGDSHQPERRRPSGIKTS